MVLWAVSSKRQAAQSAAGGGEEGVGYGRGDGGDAGFADTAQRIAGRYKVHFDFRGLPEG